MAREVRHAGLALGEAHQLRLVVQQRGALLKAQLHEPGGVHGGGSGSLTELSKKVLPCQLSYRMDFGHADHVPSRPFSSLSKQDRHSKWLWSAFSLSKCLIPISHPIENHFAIHRRSGRAFALVNSYQDISRIPSIVARGSFFQPS